MKMNHHFRIDEKIAIYIISIPTMLIGIFFTYAGFSEFIEVAVNGGAGYTFGCFNECIWFYQSASIYSTYCFASGLLFFIGLFTQLFGFFKKRLWLTIGGTIFILLLLIAVNISINRSL